MVHFYSTGIIPDFATGIFPSMYYLLPGGGCARVFLLSTHRGEGVVATGSRGGDPCQKILAHTPLRVEGYNKMAEIGGIE